MRTILQRLTLFGLLFLLFGVQHSRQLRAVDTPQLYLHRGVVDVRDGQTAVSSHQLLTNTHIIQFNKPITKAMRQQVADSGLQIMEYLPDYAYLVQGSAQQLQAIAQLDTVYGHQPFTAADKLSPALLKAAQKGNSLSSVQVYGWNGRLLNSFDTITPSQLWIMAATPSVRWIEGKKQYQLFNDEARQITHVNTLWQDSGLYGAGQIVGIADSGLDTGNLATLSPDFAGRIVAGHALVDGSSWNDDFGHGTHVAGSLLGAGVQSGANPVTHDYINSFAGVAPEAGLVVQGFETSDTGSVVGLPDDFYTLFEQAYDDGARIHSNSWGGATGESGEAQYGGYPFESQRVDAFVYDHPDMTIFFAAGNSGQDGSLDAICFDGDGVVDADSMNAPGTAKNVITVGATENDRPTGGAADTTWLTFLLSGLCFLTDPLASDLISDNPNGMAGFSSRGPTDDGRIKPDIVAPGTNIVSNRSHVDGANTLYGVHETNEHYVYAAGTSMATPLAAGMSTLIREWLNENGVVSPTAALIKALLLNGAVDIAPGQYGTGATQEIPSQWPNSVAGWGRADLDFLTSSSERPVWYHEDEAGLETAVIDQYLNSEATPLTVIDASEPLRIHLVWTDPPASLSASKQLVNDLDLIITTPDGTTLYGNGVVGGDRLNNVEGIVLNTPQLGSYTITVRGHNVPMGPQPYALVVSGAVDASQSPPPSPPPVDEDVLIYLPLIRKE